MARKTKHPEALYKLHLPVAVAEPGATIDSIAYKLGLTPSGVRQALARYNIPTPTQVRNAVKAASADTAATYAPNHLARVWIEREPQLRAAIAAGLSMEYLTDCYDAPQCVIQYWLRKLRIPPTRPRTKETKHQFAILREAYRTNPEQFAALPKPGEFKRTVLRNPEDRIHARLPAEQE